MKNHRLMLFSLLTLSALPASAGALQSHAQIRDTVTAFVRTQIQALPGKVSFQVANIDPRIALPSCTALEAFLPPGAILSGNSNVGVRCNSKQNWSLFVQVNVKITMSMLTLKRTLQTGQTVHAEDIGALSSESVPAGTLTDPAQAIGKIMKYSVGTGQILRHDMLRAPYSIKQGETVKLQVKGSGFSVDSEGQALANAADGENISARTASGQIISGVAKSGCIEIYQ